MRQQRAEKSTNPVVDRIRVIEATISLGPGVTVKGYMTPGGSFRYGLEYTSILLGYGKNYLSRLIKPSVEKTDFWADFEPTKKASKKLKELISRGFRAYKVPVRFTSDTGRQARAETLSFDDFCVLVEYEASVINNPKAIALLTASFREVLRSRSLEAFGLEQDSLEKRREDFTKALLERENILAENRAELEELALPGDEGVEYDMMARCGHYIDWETFYPEYFEDTESDKVDRWLDSTRRYSPSFRRHPK